MLLLIGLGLSALFLAGREPIGERIHQFLIERQYADLPIRLASPYRVAIVVPCYNHADYVRTALKSAFAQSYRPLEVVCVNDCSSDKTSDILYNIVPPDDIGYTVIDHSVNLGQCTAINTAIESTSADTITILNDDDYLMHDAVEMCARILSAYPDIYMTGGGSINFQTDEDIANSPKTISSHIGSGVPPLRHYEPADALDYHYSRSLQFTHSSLTFFRCAWEASGGYYTNKERRVTYSGDRDFQMRVSSLFPVASAPSSVPFSFWRQGSSVDFNLYS